MRASYVNSTLIKINVTFVGTVIVSPIKYVFPGSEYTTVPPVRFATSSYLASVEAVFEFSAVCIARVSSVTPSPTAPQKARDCESSIRPCTVKSSVIRLDPLAVSTVPDPDIKRLPVITADPENGKPSP